MDVTTPHTHLRGFSLVELLTTLAVALLLATTAVPAWQELTARNNIAAARTQLATALALARSAAIESLHHVTVCPSSDKRTCSGDYRSWHSGILLFRDDNADRQHDPDEPILRIIDPQPGVRIESSSGRRSIRYSPQGYAWGSNLTLRFCTSGSNEYNRAIILHGSGRARAAERLPDGSPVTCS